MIFGVNSLLNFLFKMVSHFSTLVALGCMSTQNLVIVAGILIDSGVPVSFYSLLFSGLQTYYISGFLCFVTNLMFMI
jgi:hypothetical protein